MSDAPPRPLALVTGASTGIGLELAKQFAEHGFDLVVAADEPQIAQVGVELERLGARAHAVQIDLATPAGVQELHTRVIATGRPLQAAALNAGRGFGGAFVDIDLDKDLAAVDLNVRSTVHLAKLVVRDMVARGEGRLLLTSSIAASMPGPYQAVYNASKSFVQSFALALREELAARGVSVTALMPGPTDTDFFDRGEMTDTRLGASEHKDDAADVARDGFQALMAGEERVVSHSLSTRFQARTSRLMPDRVKAKMGARMAEPGSAGDDED
jgi:uncharacterized protein